MAGLVGVGCGSGYRFGKRLAIVLTFLKKTFFWNFFFFQLGWGGDYVQKTAFLRGEDSLIVP